LFYILQTKCLNKNCISFDELLAHKISGLMLFPPQKVHMVATLVLLIGNFKKVQRQGGLRWHYIG